MRKVTAVMLAAILLLSGCSNDIEDIENLNYATAIGVDFRDDKYFIYIQLVDLDSVARAEGGKKAPGATIVSESSDKTFFNAFFSAYKSAQERILWAHVGAVVISEEALKKGIHHIFDGLTRYRELRMTPWVFTTRDSVEEILSSKNLFGQTLSNILQSPKTTHTQNSRVRPIKMFKFARELFEPGFTTYLPSLKINNSQWKRNLKATHLLEIEGAVFLKNASFLGYYNYEDIVGLRWVEQETARASIHVPDEDNPEFLVAVENLKVKESVDRKIGSPIFDLTVKAKGNVSNRVNNNETNLEKMEKMTSEKIKDEITLLYQLGIDNQIDFLNLEHTFYRENTQDWQKLKKSKGLFLTENSLGKVKVDITLEHSGAFKDRVITLKEVE